jgi:hypothetical protein
VTETAVAADVVFPDVDTSPVGGQTGVICGEWVTAWVEIRAGWLRTVAAYAAEPGDALAAWNYLDRHPAFWCFWQGAWFDPAPRNHVFRLSTGGAGNGVGRQFHFEMRAVDPDRAEINLDDADRNTAVWPYAEFGPSDPFAARHWCGHAARSDDGTIRTVAGTAAGPTLDAALIRAAGLLRAAYGDDRRVCDSDPWLPGSLPMRLA